MDTIDIIKIATAIVALIIAVVGHEIMHGWVAYKYGDHTAKDQGRLSLNPIVHIDLFGTILVPAMMYFIPMLFGASSGLLFGWAKPVPINTRTVLENGGYNAAMQVSLAGIAYNLFMATLSSTILLGMAQPGEGSSLVEILLYMTILQLVFINTILAVFNLLPIPQFDGAHFLTYLSLKLGINKLAEFFIRMEPYGMIIVIIMLVVDPIRNLVLAMPVQYLLHLLLS